MRSHILKVLGIIFFVLIALGSASSNRHINNQNNLSVQNKWTLIATGSDVHALYDPYTLSQVAQGVWQFMYWTTPISGSGNKYAPVMLTLYCHSNQYEQRVAYNNGQYGNSSGIQPIHSDLLLFTVQKQICGQKFNFDNNNYHFVTSGKSSDGKKITQYYVKDNVVDVDLNDGIRKLKVAGYVIQEQKIYDYTLFVNCEARQVRFFYNPTKKFATEWAHASGNGADPASVFWSRACDNRYAYMTKLSSGKQLTQSDFDSATCKKYGFKPRTNDFATCMFQIDQVRNQARQQHELYMLQKKQYESQVAAQNETIRRDRNERQSRNMLEMGLRMMGGQTPVEAAASVGTGAPIIRQQSQPLTTSTQTYRLPGGKMMLCTTTGHVTNCY